MSDTSRTDGELLVRHIASGDESAFAELVSRHEQMVYRTCLRHLHDRHEAEDACQAVFLVLLAKEKALSRKREISAWLHGVARNVALQALRARASRARHEKGASVQKVGGRPADAESEGQAVLDVLDRELNALSGAQREAVILRYLKGYSERDAARALGCPLGTLSRRASDGIARLRRRFAGRGLTIGTASLVALLGSEAGAGVPAGISASILGIVGVANHQGQALLLAKGVIKAMFWKKIQIAAVSLVTAASLIGGGALVRARAGSAGETAGKPLPPAKALKIDWKAVKAQAAGEYLKPIHPGLPGKRPFWNGHAGRFLFPPAFEFKPVAGAKHYRYTIQAGKKTLVFESAEPWAPLTPIWKDLPSRWSVYDLKVEGLKAKGGEAIAAAKITVYNSKTKKLEERTVRSFRRLGGIGGPYGKTHSSREYAASALRCLRYMRQHKLCQSFKEKVAGGVWKSPFHGSTSKMMNAAVRGMVSLAKTTPDKAEAAEALKMARNAADCMIAMSVPKGMALEYFPPSYASWQREMRMNDAFRAGHAYLNLYDLCKDEKYLTAAKRIADTYRKTQLPSGAWHYIMNAKGEPSGKNKLMPSALVLYFDRLAGQYGCKQYAETRKKAFKWVLENPIKSYNWEGQFDDVSPQAAYRNHSHYPAVHAARCILNRAKEDPDRVETAEELLRFAEDQFITWWPWPKCPMVSEQYVCYSPVNGSISQMIRVYMQAYEVTGKEFYLAKSISLANTIVKYHKKAGCYPTWVFKGDSAGWPNCPIGTACAMLEFAERLEAVERKRAGK